MSKVILQENYITALVPLVSKAEEQHDLSSLHHLCNIMKSLILFNDNAIIEHTVKDRIILGVVGALECTLLILPPPNHSLTCNR